MSSRITVEQTNRTIICSVVFVDLVEYSKRPVGEQMVIKDRFTALLAESLKNIALGDRIVLDTGDGAAMSFLGDPEDALFVAMSLRDSMKVAPEGAAFRIGVNLGPVRLVRDINGQPNIVGDGINVAQRIMSFAEPGQLLVSRSYYDAVSCLAEEYGKLFRYDGSRTDKHVRDHDVYVVGESESAFTRAKTGMERRAAQTNPNLRPAAWDTGAREIAPGAAVRAGGFRKALVAFLRDRTKVNVTGSALGTLVVVLAAILVLKAPAPRPALAAQPPAPGAEAAGAVVAVTAKAEEPKGALKQEAVPGTVMLSVTPWGEVFVNGKSRGLTPPVKHLKLPPGTYRIEIRNT